MELIPTLSFNKPKLCPNATWNPNAATFANSTIIGQYPYGIFINTNNTVYISETYLARVQVWSQGSITPMRTISGGLNETYNLFVTINGDVYVDNGLRGQVSKWTGNSTSSTPVMYVNGACYGLFVDINNTIYCSLGLFHKVIRRTMGNAANVTQIIAGTGNYGTTPNTLYYPYGIFVDTNFSLYVADCVNHRIQLFPYGKLNATTIAGNGANGTIVLNYPTAIAFDGNGYLFIVEKDNHRIVRSGPNGYRCIIGCSGISGSASNQLNIPWSLSFDTYGNIFVTDQYNHRIQKFLLIANSCVDQITTNSIQRTTKAVATTSKAVEATSKAVVITSIAAATTSKAVATTSKAVETTSKAVETTSKAVVITSIAVATISKAVATTSKAVETTSKAVETTSKAVVITSKAVETTSKAVETTSKAVETTSKAVATTSKAVEATSKAVVITAKAVETISKAEETTAKVAETTTKGVESTSKGAEITSTTAGTTAKGVEITSKDIELTAKSTGATSQETETTVKNAGPTSKVAETTITGTETTSRDAEITTKGIQTTTKSIVMTVKSTEATIKHTFESRETTVDQTRTTALKELFTSTQKQSSISTTMAPVTTSKVFDANQTCFAPVITLIPSTSSLTSPIQFRRNQDFYISSNIELNCHISLSTITQWTITNCTSNCSFQIQFNPTIITTFNELLIPGGILNYGTYELKITVTMTASLHLTSSASVYVKIIPSDITANLVQLGTSMITRGYEQDLILDSGTYSVNPDQDIFNASDWNYEYYCRIYGLYDFPHVQQSLLTIDDPRIDSFNSSCLSNRSDNNGTSWQYIGPTNAPNSSLKIFAGSLAINRTYQFMISMKNHQNTSLQIIGYLLVQVNDTSSPMIAIGCVIPTMCISQLEYQLINPTTQITLFSMCSDSCSSIRNITWNIYQGFINSTSNITSWTLFNQYQNIEVFGLSTSNFTVTNKLFLNNPQIQYWRFEVIYSFPLSTSSSALHFLINQPPRNGSCSINPLNGSTNTLFTISCPNWFDEDGIKDYSFYTWTTDRSKLVMIAFTSLSNFNLRLPAGDDNISLLNIIMYIRDNHDCITEYNISSINVIPDLTQINNLINNLENSTNEINNNPFVRLLASGSQNTVAQIIILFSQQLNIETPDIGDIPATSIFISPLGSQSLQNISLPSNTSILTEYNKQLNTYATIRDFLIKYVNNLTIIGSNSIKLQSSILVQITQSTSQLTRTTLLIASEKCYQLAQGLYSIAYFIPYEDVQITATQIMQCISNILSAVNGPLQNRTIVLDLDFSNANAFPDDYDTDLEFEWSNPNLFADENDFSWETIENNRNIYYQKQLANIITIQMTEIISLITAVLNIHLNIEQIMIINTSEVFMSLEIISAFSLANKSIQQIENTQIHIPLNFNVNLDNNEIISLRSMIQPLALFDKSQSNTNLSRLISFSILDRNGNEISIQTNFDQPIELIIPRDPNLILSPIFLQNVTSVNFNLHNQLFNLHFVNLANTQSVSVHFEIHPLNRNLAYLFIYKFDGSPRLNSSINQIDGWSLFCPLNLTNEGIYTYFITNQQTADHRSVVFGLRELNSTEINSFCSNQSINSPPISNQPFNFTSNYKLRIYISGCYYLDSNNNWQSSGLIVGPLTNHYQTQCFSTHLTTFAGGFLVLPEPINWNYVFTNADFIRNKTIYITVIFVCLIYLLLIVYARFQDKKDLEKLGTMPLLDNHKADQYFYQIIVFTGHRKYSGTKSKVHFVLSGDKHKTRIRTFADPHRKILQRNGIDAFVMTVPKSLGPLNCIHIWHDNSGKSSSASWFLKYLIVRDLQTMEKFHFICQRWLAVEKDDGKIERGLPVAGMLEKKEFSYLLSKQAYYNVSDGHLWFSIFSRPPSNKFTRVQRCTCCFVLFFISMLLNIIYYDLSTETKDNTNNSVGISLGSLRITSEQIGSGVIVEILALIPSLLLVQLFRRIRIHQKQISPLRQTLNKSKQQSTIKKKSQLTFPWWWIFIAYSLSFLLVALSIIFIIARGIEFGDLKTQKWLMSTIISFFSSIFLTQPIKILCMTIFFAYFIRNTNDDNEAAEQMNDDNLNLEKDEEYLHAIKTRSLFIYRPPIRANRLNEFELSLARRERQKEIYMWLIIQKALTYLSFLFILFMITYSNRDQNAFLQVNHFRKYFSDYKKVTTINDYWNWLENSFISNLRAQQWYNNDSPENLNGFINDKSNRLIGWATITQFRIKSNSCHIPNSVRKTISICVGDYNILNEEKRSFQPGWINETKKHYSSTIQRAFEYQSNEYVYVGDYGVYSGGGYIYEVRGPFSDLKKNLSQLYQLNWIDRYTRAVIIQLTLYNPNVQLFTSVTFLTEFLSTGGIVPKFSFEPLNFYVFSSIFQLICGIIYVIFIIYFMMIEMQSFYRLKWSYFQKFWCYIELGIIICSWTSVGVYIWRYHESIRISRLFKETNGYVYINLQFASYVNNIFIFLLGFCCFLSTLRLLHFGQCNRHLAFLSETLHYAKKELILFTILFFIIFMAFVCLFYLLFFSKISTCSSLLNTVQMLSMLSKFHIRELYEIAPFLAPFCVSLYILLVVFVCMRTFMSIINENFRSMRKSRYEDYEIILFMWQKFQIWSGLKKLNEEEIQEERDALMRSQYVNTIEGFPEKVDQLLEAINRLYMDQRAEIERIERAMVYRSVS